MPLLSLWKNAKEAVLEMTIEQIVSNAGDGRLLDNALSSEELRALLAIIPVESLVDYARRCLESKFEKAAMSYKTS